MSFPDKYGCVLFLQNQHEEKGKGGWEGLDPPGSLPTSGGDELIQIWRKVPRAIPLQRSRPAVDPKEQNTKKLECIKQSDYLFRIIMQKWWPIGGKCIHKVNDKGGKFTLWRMIWTADYNTEEGSGVNPTTGARETPFDLRTISNSRLQLKKKGRGRKSFDIQPAKEVLHRIANTYGLMERREGNGGRSFLLFGGSKIGR